MVLLPLQPVPTVPSVLHVTLSEAELASVNPIFSGFYVYETHIVKPT